MFCLPIERAYSWSPSRVIIDKRCRPFDSVILARAASPKRETEVTFECRSRDRAFGQRAPPLQLPHQMRRFPSIRQLHSIISPHSPRDLLDCRLAAAESLNPELKEDRRTITLPDIRDRQPNNGSTKLVKGRHQEFLKEFRHISACSRSYPKNYKSSPECNPCNGVFARCRLVFRGG